MLKNKKKRWAVFYPVRVILFGLSFVFLQKDKNRQTLVGAAVLVLSIFRGVLPASILHFQNSSGQFTREHLRECFLFGYVAAPHYTHSTLKSCHSCFKYRIILGEQQSIFKTALFYYVLINKAIESSNSFIKGLECILCIQGLTFCIGR